MLSTLNNTSYGDFDPDNQRWLNATGLRAEDGYPWPSLRKIKERISDIIYRRFYAFPQINLDTRNSPLLPLYTNITGFVRGQWVHTELHGFSQNANINLSKITPDNVWVTTTYDRNITGKEGKVHFRFDEKKGETLNGKEDGMGDEFGSVRELVSTMTLQDETSTGDGWEIKMYGVHFPEVGGVVLSTTSDKWVDYLLKLHKSIVLIRSQVCRNICPTPFHVVSTDVRIEPTASKPDTGQDNSGPGKVFTFFIWFPLVFDSRKLAGSPLAHSTLRIYSLFAIASAYE